MEAFGGVVTKKQPLERADDGCGAILTINSFILDEGRQARVVVECPGVTGPVSCAILSSAEPSSQCSLVFPGQAKFLLAPSSDSNARVSILGTMERADSDDELEDDTEFDVNEYDDMEVPPLVMDFDSTSTDAGSDSETSGLKIEEVFDKLPSSPPSLPTEKETRTKETSSTVSPSASAPSNSQTKNQNGLGNSRQKRPASVSQGNTQTTKKTKVTTSQNQPKPDDSPKPSTNSESYIDSTKPISPNIKKVFPNGLKYEITVAGTGKKCALKGKKVTVAYTGSLATTRKQFDKGKLSFVVGAGEVVPGFDQSVEGMLLGESRMCFIPSHLGYGKKGAGKIIPPNAPLVFDLQLTQVW